jgi:hypothetical protein
LRFFPGDGSTTAFPLPANWQRMLKTSEIYSTAQPTLPLTFVSDPDEWLTDEMNGWTDPGGAWTIYGDQLHVRPAPAAGVQLKCWYLQKNCIALASGASAMPSSPTPTPSACPSGCSSSG